MSENLAKWLHDNYEEIARQNKWDTQEDCKVEFDDLPQENKDTMIELARRLELQSEKDRDELLDIRVFLLREGYSKCDRAACNCGSYHKELEKHLEETK